MGRKKYLESQRLKSEKENIFKRISRDGRLPQYPTFLEVQKKKSLESQRLKSEKGKRLQQLVSGIVSYISQKS